MLKVLDVFPIGNMLSVTLEGPCDNIKNGCKLVDSNGNAVVVISVHIDDTFKVDFTIVP